MKINIDYEDLVTVAETAGLTEDAVYPDYSGRGMYGATCVGFVLRGSADQMRLGIALRDVLGNAAATRLLTGIATDDMGLGTIVYFPGATTDAP